MKAIFKIQKGEMMIKTSNPAILSLPANFPTERKIQGFKKLENGWNYGEGVALEQSILDSAIALHQEAIRLVLFETDAFPGLNGEVMFTIYFENHYLEFTLEPDGGVTFYHEKNGEEICYQEGLSFEKAKAKIREFRKEIGSEKVLSKSEAAKLIAAANEGRVLDVSTIREILKNGG